MVMRMVRINLFMVTVILISIGVVMIYSASGIYAAERYKDSLFFLKRHISFIVVGSALALGIMLSDYNYLRRFAKPMVAAALVLLVLVLIPHIGREVAGARRWFRFRFLSFQPSEFANLALVVYIADFICRKEAKIKSLFKGLFPAVAVLGVTALLILLQPDLGTTIALAAVVFIMLFVAGVPWRYLLFIFLGAGLMLYVLIVSEPYRMRRITAFLNPWADPRGSGFQIIQSQIAMGSGGIFGVGLGHSMQKLFYLPAAHTDFIFSIIGEELGLIGTLAVIAAFGVFAYAGMRIALDSRDPFGKLLAGGLTSMIVVQALMNMAAVTGLMPITGIPLPLVSAGGSSLTLTLACIGLILAVARNGGATRVRLVRPKQTRGSQGAGTSEWRRDSGAHLPRVDGGRPARRRGA